MLMEADRLHLQCLNPKLPYLERFAFSNIANAFCMPHEMPFLPGQSTLSPVFLEFPVSIIKGADLPCLQPTRDTMEVKCML